MAAHKLAFDMVPSGWVADTGAGITLRLFMGDALVNASVLRTSTIERQYLDHTLVDDEYFTRQALNALAVDAKQAAVAAYTKTYLSKSATITSARAAGATDIAAPTCGVLNTSWNVGRICFKGSSITGSNFVMSASFNIDNNRRAQKAIGALGAIGIGNGEFTVAGKLQTNFGNASVYSQILNNTLTSSTRVLAAATATAKPCCSISGGQALVRLTSGLRQEPGRHDRCRLPGRHARLARLHHAGAALLLPAELVQSLSLIAVARAAS